MAGHNNKFRAQTAALLRSPKALSDFQCSGRLPNVVTPSSPLIDYLESIPPRERARMTNVRLSPMLGYHSSAWFVNAEHMLAYIKPYSYMTADWPARTQQINFFNTPITDALFERAQQS